MSSLDLFGLLRVRAGPGASGIVPPVGDDRKPCAYSHVTAKILSKYKIAGKYPFMDEIDRKIIGIVQSDGRVTSATLASQVGLSVSAANDRLRRLQERGVITGWTAQVDPEALGFGLLAFLFVLIDRTEQNAPFLEAAKAIPEVQELHHVTGEWSYLLKVRTASTRALETLISDRIKAIPGVARSMTFIALSSSKETAALPVAGSEDRPR